MEPEPCWQSSPPCARRVPAEAERYYGDGPSGDVCEDDIYKIFGAVIVFTQFFVERDFNLNVTSVVDIFVDGPNGEGLWTEIYFRHNPPT